MGWLEEEFIFPLLSDLSDFYLRFIDEIFLIWNETKTEFYKFFKKKQKMNVILASILNRKCLKQKKFFSTLQC